MPSSTSSSTSSSSSSSSRECVELLEREVEAARLLGGGRFLGPTLCAEPRGPMRKSMKLNLLVVVVVVVVVVLIDF